MADIRMKWEPDNLCPLDEICAHMRVFSSERGGVTVLKNGTLLFIRKNADDVASARKALEEAKFLTDFRVKALSTGDFLVALHRAVAVFVGRREFDQRRAEILRRVDELKFPSEQLLVPTGWSQDDFLIGLYGRGKMQRDIFNFSFHERL